MIYSSVYLYSSILRNIFLDFKTDKYRFNWRVREGDEFKKFVPGAPFPLPCACAPPYPTPSTPIQKSLTPLDGLVTPPITEQASVMPPPPACRPHRAGRPRGAATGHRCHFSPRWPSVGPPASSDSHPVADHHPPSKVFFNLGCIWNLVLVWI
jgi:hypothetical protein